MIKKILYRAQIIALNSPIVPVVTFSFLFSPFFGLPPCFDAIAFFDFAKVFFTGGLDQYLLVRALHPPFPAILQSAFFKFLGDNVTTLNLIGYLQGIVGIIAIYFLSKKLFGKQVGILSAMLLALCPIYISNSVHLLLDFSSVVYILLALYFYSTKKIVLYAIMTSMLVLTKDTGLLLPLSVIAIEILHNFKELFIRINLKRLINFFLLFIPVILYGAWLIYVGSHGLQVWHENIFAETRDKGAFITILHNVLTFDFFHKWAIRHRTILFYMNFNWVYWAIGIIGSISFITKYGWKRVYESFASNNENSKTKLIILLFCILYFFTVLTFQTFTAPRYDLPILVFLYILVARTIGNSIKKIPLYVLILFSIFTFVRLFYSIDPVSSFLFEKRQVSGQEIYYFDDAVDGNDIIVYNLQYLLIIKDRTRTTQAACWFYY